MANNRLVNAWKLVIDLAKLKNSGEYDHDNVLAVIASQNTIDAVPVVHGRWIEKPIKGRHDFKYECSVCQGGADLKTRYCPHCAARMDLPNITDATAAALERMGANAHGGENPELLYGSSPCINLPKRKESVK